MTKVRTVVRPFGEIARVGSAMVDPTIEPYLSMSHVGPENIESETGRLSDIRSAEECGLISLKYEFDEKAIVYSKIRPNLNKVAFPRFHGVCSADAYPVWAREDVIDTEYLLHVMRSPAFLKQAVAVSARTGMPKINRAELASLRVPLPPLAVQGSVARCLTSLDDEISLVRDLATASADIAQALAQALLSGRRRFLRFAKSAWASTRLGDAFVERDEIGHPRLQLLAITADRGVIRRGKLTRRDTSAGDKSRYKRIAPGDIGYNTMRMWQGVSGQSMVEGIVSPAYTVVTPKNGVILPEFAAHLFKYPPVIHRFLRLSQGLVDDTLNLKYPAFSQIRVDLPVVSEQRAIAQVLDTAATEIRVLGKLATALQEQRRGLLNRLLAVEGHA